MAIRNRKTSAALPHRPGDALPTSTADSGQVEPVPKDQSDRGEAPAEVPAAVGVPSTRVGALWVGLCAAAVLFVALIVFLLQNTRRTEVSFLWLDGSAPLAIMLLIAAVAATLLTLTLGTARITQLRQVAKRRASGESTKA
ncbi:DUF1049 domain-containing protein [Kribbella qitaiheensis]|uniref:DUF1049 domain-containing protein n=1 Tax=Kribbella qitaiheensis TaxID=1544730 RepID=A0A7G6WSM4_9ACTN|nr:DUF1049 domain-containing protein [Kribbella qitaiheensis]QNE16989.1 DUF1049 domain-containing protein [Kribbella qitaiheensis]